MDKYNIIFSIPIHEKYEVVIDLILNIFNYNHNCAIVLHYANGIECANSAISFAEFENAISKIGNVYVNPETVRTGMYDIIQAHVSNFRYIESIADFDFFALTASNELFIKEGLYNHIRDYDAGVTFIDVDSENKWIISDLAKKDTVLSSYLTSNGWDKIMGSHVEGSFYRKELMSDIVGHIERFFDYRKKGVFYPRDEVFFPTLLWNISQNNSLKILNPGLYCWTPWDKSFLQWDILVNDVKRLCKSSTQFFSVKRVPRVNHNYVRSYIRENGGYLEKEQNLFDVEKQDLSNWVLMWLDFKNNLFATYKGQLYQIKSFLLQNRFIYHLNDIKNAILKKEK